MSRKRAGRFSSAATLAARAPHHPGPTPVVDDERSQGEAARESAAAKNVWATRPLRRTPAGPSRNAAQVSFNDPSNYLG